MKKLIILIGLLMFITSHAKTKHKSVPRVTKITIQGSNDGIPTYKVILSDGRTFEYMYMSEIKESKRTGIWAYNEMLEYNHK